jgi:hypothetical protein
VCVLVAACGNDSAEGPIPIAALGSAFTSYICGAEVRCGVVSDFSTCVKLRKWDGLLDPLDSWRPPLLDLVAAVEAGAIVYDGNAARACLAAISSGCDQSILWTNRGAPTACDEMFAGTVAGGGPCGLNEECISQQCSNPNCLASGTPIGTCIGDTPPVRPTLGESCQQNANCVDGYCDNTTLTCAALLSAGAMCTVDNQCQLGLACSRGMCGALADEGSACTMDGDCKSIGNYCGATGTCRAYALAGASCASEVCSYLAYRCDSNTSRCVLAPELGEKCVATLDCIDRSYCDSTTSRCVALLPDGASCQADEQCASGTCLFQPMTSPGTCVTLVCI